VHRGFDYLEFATHGVMGALHYAKWIRDEHPDAMRGFYQVGRCRLQRERRGGGDTHAPQVKYNPGAARVVPHGLGGRSNDPLARGTRGRPGLVFVDELPRSPSPVGPAEVRDRSGPVARRTTAQNYPQSANERESLLDQKARHWRAWYDGRFVSNYEAPAKWVPASMTADQVT